MRKIIVLLTLIAAFFINSSFVHAAVSSANDKIIYSKKPIVYATAKISKDGSKVDFGVSIPNAPNLNISLTPWIDLNRKDNGAVQDITVNTAKSTSSFKLDVPKLNNNDIITLTFYPNSAPSNPVIKKFYLISKDGSKILSLNEIDLSVSFTISNNNLIIKGKQEAKNLSKQALKLTGLSSVPWFDLKDENGTIIRGNDIKVTSKKSSEAKVSFEISIPINRLKIGSNFINMPFYAKLDGATPYENKAYMIHRDGDNNVLAAPVSRYLYVTYFENLNK